MASISDDGDGRRLLFTFGGKRRTIRLGAVTAKTATEIICGGKCLRQITFLGGAISGALLARGWAALR